MTPVTTLVQPTSASNSYDVANPGSLKIPVPQVTSSPAVCYTIDDFKIENSATSEEPTFIKLSSDKTNFEVDTSDRKDVNFYTLTVKPITRATPVE